VTDGLEKLGTAAYNLIPKSIKDAINNDALDKGKQPEGQPPQNRRSSVTGKSYSTHWITTLAHPNQRSSSRPSTLGKS
jgi:hypothetical protein